MTDASLAVVDAHRHWWHPGGGVDGPIADAVGAFFAETSNEDPADSRRRLLAEWIDHTGGRRVVDELRTAGIDRAILLVGGFALDRADPGRSLAEQNEATIAMAERHADRLAVFVGVHPAAADPAGTVARLLDHAVVGGVKLDPLAGDFSPDDERLHPVYALLEERGLGVVCHTGPRPGAEDDDLAHPRRVVPVLERFPRLPFVAAHAAFAWWRDLLPLAERAENLLCDISGYQLTAAVAPGKVAGILRRLLDAFGAQRVLFGTDAPTFDRYLSSAAWLRFLRGLAEGGAVAPSELDQVLRAGAQLLRRT